MSAKIEQAELIRYWTVRCRQLLQSRNNLTRNDLEYLVEKAAALKDERLKQSIAALIGWGDEERAELETFCAIGLELMADATPSRIREAARKVEIRFLTRKTT
jgi:hypothetical protein